MSSPAGTPSVIRLADLDLDELPGALVVYGPDGRVHDATAAACDPSGRWPHCSVRRRARSSTEASR